MLNIKIDHVSIGDRALFDNVSIDLRKGELLILLGSMGSGKTTLLKVVAGLSSTFQHECIVKSRMSYEGREITPEQCRRLVGMSFQEPEHQFLLSTVDKEILSHVQTDNELKRAKELLAIFEMKSLLKKSLKDLSTGQKKLVSLVSVLCQDKPILLFDEPAATLDSLTLNRLREYINALKRERIIILSAHEKSMLLMGTKFLRYAEESGKWLLSKHPPDESPPVTPWREIRTAKENLVELKSVHYAYPNNSHVLSDVTFNVHKGEILCLVGENGSGKTTLLDIISGSLNPVAGEVIRLKHNSSIGQVMQEPEKQLFTSTVLDELTFATEIDIRAREVKDVLRRMGLSGYEGEHPLFLSRGQKQALVLAAVLLSKPDLLIIDEPFTGLDTATRTVLQDLLITANEQIGTTIILADQESDGLQALSDRILCLKKGTLFETQLLEVVKRNNWAMLIIKPEATRSVRQILRELRLREYAVIHQQRFMAFSKHVARLYAPSYPVETRLRVFADAYAHSRFPDEFIVLVLRHKNMNTLNALNKDIGGFISYQLYTSNKREKHSLRGQFGKSSAFNFTKDGFTVIFNGLHKIDTVENIAYQAISLGLELEKLENQ